VFGPYDPDINPPLRKIERDQWGELRFEKKHIQDYKE